jgi:hypothetical protein
MAELEAVAKIHGRLARVLPEFCEELLEGVVNSPFKTPGGVVAAVCDRRNRARMRSFFGAHRAPLQFLNGLLSSLVTVSLCSAKLFVTRNNRGNPRCLCWRF